MVGELSFGKGIYHKVNYKQMTNDADINANAIFPSSMASFARMDRNLF